MDSLQSLALLTLALSFYVSFVFSLSLPLSVSLLFSLSLSILPYSLSPSILLAFSPPPSSFLSLSLPFFSLHPSLSFCSTSSSSLSFSLLSFFHTLSSLYPCLSSYIHCVQIALLPRPNRDVDTNQYWQNVITMCFSSLELLLLDAIRSFS